MSATKPTCPTHKCELVSAVFETQETSELQGRVSGFECPTPGCKVKYSMDVSGDSNGYFTLDENGRPIPLP